MTEKEQILITLQINEAVAAEREACAKLAASHGAHATAKAIRDRAKRSERNPVV